MDYSRLLTKFGKGWLSAGSVSVLLVEALGKQGCDIGHGLKPFGVAVGLSVLGGLFHAAVDAYKQNK